MTPSQYFDILKSAKQKITSDALKESFETFIVLAEKYKKLGQKESLKKLLFLADTLIKEEKLIDLGITTYIYRDVVSDYIEHIADKTVKIVELSRYLREIPDELVEVVENTREIFDEHYVVFTDYTGKEERKVDKERRDKDPILFGVFRNGTTVADRFYFLGDWVDDFCDLTLDKMVAEYKEKKGINPTLEFEIPKTSNELIEVLSKYKEDVNKGSVVYSTLDDEGDVPLLTPSNVYVNTNTVPEKQGFVKKVRSFLSKTWKTVTR